MARTKKRTEQKRGKEDTRDWKGFLPLPTHGDERCLAAVTAFNYGDFRKARGLAREILADESPGESKAVASDILRRTDTDFVVLGIALAGILVVLFIFLWAVTSSHP